MSENNFLIEWLNEEKKIANSYADEVSKLQIEKFDLKVELTALRAVAEAAENFCNEEYLNTIRQEFLIDMRCAIAEWLELKK